MSLKVWLELRWNSKVVCTNLSLESFFYHVKKWATLFVLQDQEEALGVRLGTRGSSSRGVTGESEGTRPTLTRHTRWVEGYTHPGKEKKLRSARKKKMLGPFFPVAILLCGCVFPNDADSSNGVSTRRSPLESLSTTAASRGFSGGDGGKKRFERENFFFRFFLFMLSVSSFRCRGWRAPWTPIEGEAPVAEPSPTPSTLPVTPGAKDAQHLSHLLCTYFLSFSSSLCTRLFYKYFPLQVLICLHSISYSFLLFEFPFWYCFSLSFSIYHFIFLSLTFHFLCFNFFLCPSVCFVYFSLFCRRKIAAAFQLFCFYYTKVISFS